MDTVSRIIFGILLILGGLAWLAYTFLDAFAGDPAANDGPLGGWLPVLGGLFVSALGVIVLIF